MNIANRRLLSQQLISPEFDDPTEVVEWMGAIQAQDYKMMRWAVGIRTRKPSITEFEKAYNEGKIVRVHMLRGTWHLVAGKDYHWMQEICRNRAKRTFYGWMKANKEEIPEEDETRQCRKILKEAFRNKSSVTRNEFYELFSKSDLNISTKKFDYHIRLAEIDGMLCSGDLTTGITPTYSLVSEKIDKNNDILELSHDEALERITLQYFRSHSPATLEDFVWWTGLNKTECKKGIKMMGDKLTEKTQEGRTFYIYTKGRTRGVPKSSVLLLPSFDEYLIGYKSRDIVLKPEYQHHAHNKNGVFYPVVAINGQIQGNWKPRSKDGDYSFFTEKNHSKSKLAVAFKNFKEWGVRIQVKIIPMDRIVLILLIL
ncbi:hypothetical protein PIROE2DRAFT_13437 [Piromyces sp. E2]|nr:hypothetical protein PIROE2DRAFT_13437 [Piromyces sp. E2]|eukprot:OUM60750.1 hypothetical protein PIROE2DRAFT_13437 [Piromyces sp. E2]